MASTEKCSRVISRIGTHNGLFHCDEALACFLLKQLPQYRDAEIVRTRNTELLDKCDVVVDVGGVYNPEIHRYDHHQNTFTHTLSTVRPDLSKDKKIKLSSAGLVYAHFGIDIIKQILEPFKTVAIDIERIFLHVYDGFIEEIDAIDNGVPMFVDAIPSYNIGTHLSARVGRINPDWTVRGNVDVDKLFNKAMELTGLEFTENVVRAATIWLPARNIIKEALETRFKAHESGQILELNENWPWKNHLLELEKELKIENKIKFVIFHEDLHNTWRVQGVPIQPDSFICRVYLHKDWRGVRDENLIEVSGIDDCVFCHASGFIGGNKTRTGALEMALRSIKAAEKTDEIK